MSNELNEMMDALVGDLESEVEDEELETTEDEDKEEVLDEVDKTDEEDLSDSPDKSKSTPSELSSVLEEIKRMNSRIDGLYSQPKPANEPTKREPIAIEEVDFIGDLDVDEVTRDSKEFNKLLNNIYKKAIDTAYVKAEENVLKSIPQIVKNNVVSTNIMAKKVNKFYKDNSDLEPFRQAVASIFQEIAGSNPDKSMDDILSMTETESRRRLNLQKKAAKGAKLPNVSSQRRTVKGTVKPNKTLSQIDEMNKILN